MVVAEAPARAQVGDASDETLRAEGWEFDEARATPGNVPAGLLAVVVGPAWHGIGHGLAGDRGTANRLFAGQGIALLAAGAGLAVRNVGDESAVARSAGSALLVGGGSLFAATWFADVVGAFKGTADALPRETSELGGLTAEAYFTVLVEQGVGLDSIFVLRVPVVAPRWVLRPDVQIGAGSAYRRVGASAFWRVPLGRHRSSWDLGAVGFDENVAEYDYGRTSLAGATQVRLDLGDVFEHLGGLMWTNRVELAVDHHWYGEDARRFDPADRRIHLPVEMGLGFNANQGVHVGMGYRHRRDELVGMAGRRAGMLWGRLGILPRNRVGVDLQIEQGAFTRAWLGLQWTLVPEARLQRDTTGA